MSDTTYVGSLSRVACCHEGCGVTFGLDSWVESKLRDSGNKFFCTNGHSQVFRETTEHRLRRELAEKSKRITELACEVAHEKQIKAEERKQKKRFATMLHNHRVRSKNGVCPCCHRTFKALAAHMASKHPSFMKETA